MTSSSSNRRVARLPVQLQNHIRSGVTISSVPQCVEELIYNALDSEASCVAVRLDMSLFKVQVIDNGLGMSKEDLGRVASRYSASNDSRLYGRRGEALASLRHLSSLLQLVSRQKCGQQTWVATFVRGKRITPVEPWHQARQAAGTTVTVTGFMYNMPVRRKLVKPGLHMDEVRHVVCGLALAHPSVSFTLRNESDGCKVLQTTKCDDPKETFAALYGQSWRQHLLPIMYSTNKYKLQGFVASKGSVSAADKQFLFVNGRLVGRSRLLKHLQKLTRDTDLLCQPREETSSRSGHAVFCLSLECPATECDFVYEPRCTEVEFQVWARIETFVGHAFHQFLASNNFQQVVSSDHQPVTSASVELNLSGIVPLDNPPTFAADHAQPTIDVKGARRSLPAVRKQQIVVPLKHSTPKPVSKSFVQKKTKESKKVKRSLFSHLQFTPNDGVAEPIIDDDGVAEPIENDGPIIDKDGVAEPIENDPAVDDEYKLKRYDLDLGNDDSTHCDGEKVVTFPDDSFAENVVDLDEQEEIAEAKLAESCRREMTCESPLSTFDLFDVTINCEGKKKRMRLLPEKMSAPFRGREFNAARLENAAGDKKYLTSIISSWNNPTFSVPSTNNFNSEIGGLNLCHGKPMKFKKDFFHTYSVIGQVDAKFIAVAAAVDDNDGRQKLLLFDQHAVHERIRLEEIIQDNCSEQNIIASVDTETPVRAGVDKEEKRILWEFSNKVQRYGLHLIEAEEGIFTVKVPRCFSQRDQVELKYNRPSPLERLVTDLAKELVQILRETKGGGLGVLPRTIGNVLNSRACRGAIMFGDKLSNQECVDLLKKVSKCKAPFQCAHGRPSIAPIVDLHKMHTRLDSARPNLKRLRKQL